MENTSARLSGFTLFEFLITVAVAAIVGIIAILYINPAEQLAQGRNNQRISHINTIAGAVKDRLLEFRGAFETNCASGPLPTATKPIGTGAGNYNLETCLVPTYLTVMPLDPSVGTSTAIGYNILYTTTTMQVTISAPNAELGKTISITK